MDEKQLKNMWNYFLSLEQDLSNTSRFVEPQGQENVYSFAMSHLILTFIVLKILIAVYRRWKYSRG